MTDDKSQAVEAMRSRVAELLVRAAGGDDGAEDALVELAMREPLAQWALTVVLELHIAEAERGGGLPQPAPQAEARLEDAVRSMVEARQ